MASNIYLFFFLIFLYIQNHQKKIVIDKKITYYNSSIKNTLKEKVITYSFSIYSKQFLIIEKLIDNINDNYNINSIELKKISEVNIQELEEEL